ncbi:hypothetical protein V5N11_029406 [Cardamine amara subsp. amara]|uniref:Uncharacterized protein n=1 Tax=Cardamine amara subsp. amara TaxID=228776 RepID=A0ABD1C111_CARAN
MHGREQASHVTFVARSSNIGTANEDKSWLVCATCKKTEHTSKTCFQIIGYPPWWNKKTRQGGRGGGRGTGRGRGVIRANIAVVKASGTSAEAERMVTWGSTMINGTL